MKKPKKEKSLLPAKSNKDLVPTKALKSKLNFIIDLIARGFNRQQVIEKIEEKFEISPTSSKDMYSQAMRWLQVSSTEEREYLREKHQSMLMTLYRRAVDSGDFKEAREVINTINKMFGLNQPEKVQPTSLFEFKFNLASGDPGLNEQTLTLDIDQISISDSEVDDDDLKVDENKNEN